MTRTSASTSAMQIRVVGRKEWSKGWNLLHRRWRGDAAREMPRSKKKKSKGFGKITGRSVEVRAAAAAEPRLCRIDTSHFHPFFASLAGIESHVDCMSEFVGDVISQQLCLVIRTSINLDPVFAGDGHG